MVFENQVAYGDQYCTSPWITADLRHLSSTKECNFPTRLRIQYNRNCSRRHGVCIKQRQTANANIQKERIQFNIILFGKLEIFLS